MTPQTRIAHRWLSASATTDLESAAQAMAEGQPDAIGGAFKALAGIKDILGFHESSGEFGPSPKMWQNWYGSISKQARGRLDNIGRVILTLESMLHNPSKHSQDIQKHLLFLAEEMTWVGRLSLTQTREVEHGPFHITPMPGVTQKQTAEALEALDKASDLIRAHFPKCLYGTVYISKSLPKGGHTGPVATYIMDTDTIHLSTRTQETVGDVHAICHELGHRYEHRFWDNDAQRDSFRNLSMGGRKDILTLFDRKRREGAADDLIKIVHERKAGRSKENSPDLDLWLGHLLQKDTHHFQTVAKAAMSGGPKEEAALWAEVAAPLSGDVGVVSGTETIEPIAVTPYGRKAWTENFAEAFAFFVMGRPLPPSIQLIMEELR